MEDNIAIVIFGSVVVIALLMLMMHLYVSSYIEKEWLEKTDIAKLALKDKEIWWERGVIDNFEIASVSLSFFKVIIRKRNKSFREKIFVVVFLISYVLLVFLLLYFVFAPLMLRHL